MIPACEGCELKTQNYDALNLIYASFVYFKFLYKSVNYALQLSYDNKVLLIRAVGCWCGSTAPEQWRIQTRRLEGSQIRGSKKVFPNTPGSLQQSLGIARK